MTKGFAACHRQMATLLLTWSLALATPATANDLADGLTLDAGIVYDHTSIVSGGVERTGVDRALFDVAIDADLERLLAWRGASIAITAQALRGDDAGIHAGVYAAFSNIDEDEFSRIYKFWLEQRLGEHLRIRAGQLDANTELAASEHARAFIHSSMGFSPTIGSMPTYPQPVLGALTAFESGALRLHAALFDATGEERFSETLLMGEISLRFADSSRLAVGGWRDSNHIEEFDGGQVDAMRGVYAYMDHRLWLGENGDSVGAFVQWGNADDDWAEVTRHLGGGFVWYGPAQRKDDEFGFGVTSIELNGAVSATGKQEAETAIEVFYKLQWNDHLSLRPDLQRVRNPGGDRTLEDATLLTLRLEMRF